MATIQGVYVALFGRPADPTGLAYFNSVTKNGADLSGIGDLASTQEYKDRFAGQNNTQIVNSIYQSLFGRDAEAAGLTFFVNALNTGTLNIKNIAIAILDGAQGSDKTTVTNKVAAADLYTSHLDTAPEIGSYQGNAAAAQGRAFLATVTTTVPTAAAVDAAILTMQAAGAAGNTINIVKGGAVTVSLTEGVTENGVLKTTTNNNDTINAKDVATPATNAAADDSFVFGASGTKIDGGLGVDTLNVTIDAGGAITADMIKNVEIINVTSTDDGGAITGVKEATGLQQIWAVANSTAADVSISDVSTSTTVGLKGDLTGKTATFAFDGVDSGSSVKLALDTAKGTVAIATAGTVEVANSNTSNVALSLDAKTVNVTGSGTLNVGITDTSLESVKASGFTGNLTYDSSANKATIKSIVGGSGADTLTIAADHAKDATVDAGAGADVVKVGAATVAAKLSLTGGADADQFVFAAGIKNGGAATDTDLAKKMITITDFGTGSDVIKVSTGATSNFSHAVVPAEQAAIAAKGTLTEALTEVASYIGTEKQGAVFAWHGDSYIFVGDGTSGYDANDTVIKVAGVSDIATFTASSLVFSA